MTVTGANGNPGGATATPPPTGSSGPAAEPAPTAGRVPGTPPLRLPWALAAALAGGLALAAAFPPTGIWPLRRPGPRCWPWPCGAAASAARC